jgi:hypothetical protein
MKIRSPHDGRAPLLRYAEANIERRMGAVIVDLQQYAYYVARGRANVEADLYGTESRRRPVWRWVAFLFGL